MSDTTDGENEAQQWLQDNANKQAEWYGDTEDYSAKGSVASNATQPEQQAPSPAQWYSDGDPSSAQDVAGYAYQTVSQTTGAPSDLLDMIFGAGKKAGDYLSTAGDNLLAKIQKNPDEALKLFAGMIGSAMKYKSEREAADKKYQEERDKEQRINASVPSYKSAVHPSLIGMAMKRGDGQNYYLPNGQINRG